ncbi:MAG: hypothetical protein HYY94_05845 [Gemmatimonadetes bacterium]|nr:hypothetical protein [Gemmatimonadota bacterium]
MLLAADDAPLGDHVVAVRATSGALVNEGSFTIRIVDRLPAPPPGVSMDTGLATPVVGGGQYGARVTISAPAPEDLTVFLSVEGVSPGEPAVVNVPASITIPLGARSASFAVTTPTVTTTVGQSVRGKIGADGWLGASPLTVVPSAALSQVVLSPTSVVGGESSAVNVHLSAAVAEATVVSLSSSNPDVATPPATVTVPAGSASTFAPVPTQAVATDTSIGISATFGGVTKTAFLGVTAEAPPSPPPGGAITVKSAQYDTGKNILQVEVNDSRALAQIITVFVTSTNETIGTLTSTFKGQFAWPVNPQKITIASSAGWSMTGVTVQAK